jgi:hypothetical protein
LNLPVVVRPSLLCERLTGNFGTAAKDSLIGDGRATFVALQHQSTYQRRRVKHDPGNLVKSDSSHLLLVTPGFSIGTVRFDGCTPWLSVAGLRLPPGSGSLPDGYRYELRAEADILSKLAELVWLEHDCCRFLTFKIVVEAGDAPVRLEVTRPPESKQMIADFFGA